MKNYKFIILFFWASIEFAFAIDAGVIIFLKGEAYIGESKRKIELNHIIGDREIIVTKELTLLKIKMLDNTIVTLGANSEFIVNEFSAAPRINLMQLLNGSLRAKFNEKVKGSDEKIEIKSPNVSVGIRGTELLIETELIENSLESKLLLLEGEINPIIKDVTNSFHLLSGDGLSTHSKSIFHITSDELGEFLKDESKLLENFGIKTASHLPMASEVAPSLAESTPTSSIKDLKLSSGSIVVPIVESPIIAVKSIAEGTMGSVIKTEKANEVIPIIVATKNLVLPKDIQEAIDKRIELKKDNKCFYWVYYKVTGYDLFQRFRKNRDCDEYDFN